MKYVWMLLPLVTLSDYAFASMASSKTVPYSEHTLDVFAYESVTLVDHHTDFDTFSPAKDETAVRSDPLNDDTNDNVSDEQPAPVEIRYHDDRDPFEGFNRAMWDFNYLFLDKYFFRPIAHGYQDYVPLPMKTGVNNFVLNFEEPSSLVNNALQGKWGWAANAGGRFTINTTLGILGVIDIADMMGMPRKHDDFNEVLGYYGVPNGPYFMAPFLGPYVTREFTTDWVDGLYFPLSEFTFWQSLLKWGLKNLHARASAIDQERLLDNALDPYTFVKEAYFQHMDYKVYDGNVPTNYEEDELLDEFLDELD